MKRSPLAPMSAKRRAQSAERTKVNRFVHDRDQWCRFFDYATPGDAPIPHGGVLDVHEKVKRSSWTAGRLDPSNCVLICRDHHRWVDDHPAAAEACGLLVKSWNRPEVAS